MPARAPLVGQVITSGTPQALSLVPVTPTVWSVKAPSTNATLIYVGDALVTTSTGYPLGPGETLEIDRRPQAGAVYDLTPADLFVVGSGGVAAWLAFR